MQKIIKMRWEIRSLMSMMAYFGVAVISAILLMAVTATQGEARELVLNSGVSETHPQAAAVARFAELVKQRSGGKLTVKVVLNAKLGDNLESIIKLQQGTLDVALPDTAVLTMMVSGFGLINFPFLFNSEAEVDSLMDSHYAEKLNENLDKIGLIGLGYWGNGFRHISNDVREIKQIADLRGLRIRVIQNPLYFDMFQAMGANPVPLPFPDVYTAMEQKTINGQENTLIQFEATKFYKVQKYLTLTRHSYSMAAMLFSKKTWESLTPDERTMIKATALEVRDYDRTLMRSNDEAILLRLKKDGMQISELSGIERSELRKMTRPVMEKYKVKFGNEWSQELYFAMMRQEVAKFKSN